MPGESSSSMAPEHQGRYVGESEIRPRTRTWRDCGPRGHGAHRRQHRGDSTRSSWAALVTWRRNARCKPRMDSEPVVQQRLQAVWSGAPQLAWGPALTIVAGGTGSVSRMPFLDFAAATTPVERPQTPRWDTGRADKSFQRPTYWCHRTKRCRNTTCPARSRTVLRRRANSAPIAKARTALPKKSLGSATRTHTRNCHVRRDPRPEATFESLSTLRPAFQKDGSVTAGNASGINDVPQRWC